MMIRTLLPLVIGAAAISFLLAPLCRAGQAGGAVDQEPRRLPRVLIIGDSISIGYTVPTRALLQGVADVKRIPGNAQHTGTGLAKLDDWLGDEQWDVIHFNWGLWDLCYRRTGESGARSRDKVNGKLTTTLERYEKNLDQLVRRLMATGAELIWASTTPVPPGEIGRLEGDAAKYNAVAAKVMQRHGVTINDLYSAVLPRMGELSPKPGDVHFSAAGSRFLAGQVAASIRTALGAAPSNPPNVIIILVDDMGWTDVGCYGSTYYETPNIDALAAGGMRFTQGYAACAVCSPTRAAILTGRYPARLGVTDWIHHSGPEAKEAMAAGRNLEGFDEPRNRPMLTPRNKAWLEHEEITIAELLRPQGYVTCHVGKWHLGPEGHFPEDQGFDSNFGGFQVGSPPSYFDPYRNRNFDGINGLPSRREGEYLTDREADEAVRFIARHHDQPFFLYMSHYAVHSPIQAKKELIAKYEAKEKTNQKHPPYAAMVQSVDDAVGGIVAVLREHDLLENTLIFFTSDNGGAVHFPATDNAPLRKGKGYPYEGGIREPFIVHWPAAIDAGGVSDEPVCSIDLLPTIAQVVGAALPDDRIIDGVSLAPLLRGEGEIDRDVLTWHFPHYWWGTRIKPYSIIREGDWKLIHHYETGAQELYNLAEDIGEAHDLAAEMLEKVCELQARLDAVMVEQGAKLPKTNPDYRPK